MMDRLVNDLPPIDLDAASVSGLGPVDRTYVVPLSVAARLVADLVRTDGDWRALEVDGRRCFGDSSGGFDDGRPSRPLVPLRRRHSNPVIFTSTRRVTLVSVTDTADVTFHTDVICGWGNETMTMRPDHVLLESRSGHGSSSVDRLLRSYGHRPVRLRKLVARAARVEHSPGTTVWRRSAHQNLRVAAPQR